ncbi:MAG: energy transducer TonB [Acidobacteriaceae bacterium]|nr:energy transducer TonB [Acidobacteriaceae bacterium]
MLASVALPTVASAIPGVFTDDGSITSALRSDYKGKVLVQRKFISGQKISYNTSGDPLGDAKEGPWTTEAELRVSDVRLHGGTIIIDGERLFLVRDAANRVFRDAFSVVKPTAKQMQAWTQTRRVEIRIDTDKPFDLAAAQAAFTKVFLLPTEHLSDFVPQWWRFVLRQDEQNSAPSTDITNARWTSSEVMKIGGEVRPPQLISSAEPTYSLLARQLHYEGKVVLGIVVDAEGRLRDITVVEPVGLGLDENAVQAVYKWQFKPATRAGEPVPVQISVEVNFRLH